MQQIKDDDSFSISQIEPDTRWNNDSEKHLLMHSIHTYPAKFPPLIASEAFKYAEEEGVSLNSVADIFCGCGTVALESKIRGIPFWGCDINPVAVLITKAKTHNYVLKELDCYFDSIINTFRSKKIKYNRNRVVKTADKRLLYWFEDETYCELKVLRDSIYESIEDNKKEYKECFLCMFSSSLKQLSRWLQKSIKPQIDPNKCKMDVEYVFTRNYQRLRAAVLEINERAKTEESVTKIEEGDFLNMIVSKKHDLIVTSPPYVTSYEYADLHQLSSLWLGYTDDYKKLRKGSIGSAYDTESIDVEGLELNQIASAIIDNMKKNGVQRAKIKAVARYYSDIQRAIKKCSMILNNGGMALFVIGDSEQKGVKLSNTEHLMKCLLENGYTDIKAGKRTIEKCICVPYRDERGKFSKKGIANSEIYHEEYVISGRKA